jgi:hypothetical protein
MTVAASIFENDLDAKLSILFNRATLDPAEVGGKNIDEEITRVTLPHIKQEAEGKFRCKACNKLFKGPDFLKKHIPAKHPDLVKDLDNVSSITLISGRSICNRPDMRLWSLSLISSPSSTTLYWIRSTCFPPQMRPRRSTTNLPPVRDRSFSPPSPLLPLHG